MDLIHFPPGERSEPRGAPLRLALLVNPCAGRNCGLAAAQAAEAVFRVAGWEVSRRVTERPGDAVRLAREAAAEGFDLLCACGGDGTVSQALTGLLGTGLPLGLIPCGTGNDFCRALGLPRDPAQAARLALSGRPRAIDLLEINGGRHWSFNVCGLGFDAAVAARMNRRRRTTGGLAAYLPAVLKELLRYRPTAMRLTLDGELWEGPALLVAVANAQSYGAGMRIAPEARIDDGFLEVVVVGPLSRVSFVWNLPRVFRGTHLTHPAVRTWRCREVAVETPEPQPVLIDGDVQAATPLQVRVAPATGLLWLPEGGGGLFVER